MYDDTVEGADYTRTILESEVDLSNVKAFAVPVSLSFQLEEEDWNRIVTNEQAVFARSLPQQNQLIVEDC